MSDTVPPDGDLAAYDLVVEFDVDVRAATPLVLRRGAAPSPREDLYRAGFVAWLAEQWMVAGGATPLEISLAREAPGGCTVQ